MAYVCFHHSQPLLTYFSYGIFFMCILVLCAHENMELQYDLSKLVGIHSIHTVFTLQAHTNSSFHFRFSAVRLDSNKLVGLKMSAYRTFCWLSCCQTICIKYQRYEFWKIIWLPSISFHLLNWQLTPTCTQRHTSFNWSGFSNLTACLIHQMIVFDSNTT